MDSKILGWLALTLIIVGAINWGLVGFFQFDLVALLFGGMQSWFSRILYALIGLAGIYSLTMYRTFNLK